MLPWNFLTYFSLVYCQYMKSKVLESVKKKLYSFLVSFLSADELKQTETIIY